MSDPLIFKSSAADIFIVSSAVFGCFWGCTNAILVRSIKIEESVINDVLKGENENKSESEKVGSEITNEAT
jgi:hypothetical protein